MLDCNALASTPPAERGGGLPKDWHKMSLGALCNRPHRTSQTTIEAIMHCVRERGAAALIEPANIERLSGCDQAAKDEINNRIARLVAAKEIAV